MGFAKEVLAKLLPNDLKTPDWIKFANNRWKDWSEFGSFGDNATGYHTLTLDFLLYWIELRKDLSLYT